ncbi:Stress-activated map kinase-interacting protein 1 [Leucoagaricus sp. SymC.cos]|nr:Stress-activated map kinase-interacting protein 1 [Leucoagaricus sp. SymC.cos]
MSIISDTDYLIHNIRLSYLKEVEDLYGPRIIAFDPSYTSNPYITHATLADSERWPELTMPQSPQISDDESERPSGFPGAKLKYTQTIMGGRSGGLGLRVSGKRASTSKRMSKSNIEVPKVAVQNYVSSSTFVQEASSPSSVTTKDIAAAAAAEWPKVPDGPLPPPPVPAPPAITTTESSSPQPEVTIEGPSTVEEAPVAKVVQFIPKFKGAAEMERRRRARMAARRGPNGALAVPAAPAQPLSFSSSEDEPQPQSSDESSSDSDFGGRGARDVADEVDEFDPDFAATRTTMTSDLSDGLSVLSAGTNSISNSSAPMSYSTSTRLRPRLSPVSETGHPSTNRTNQLSVGKDFEMLTPAVSAVDSSKQTSPTALRQRSTSGGSTKQSSTSTPAPENLFVRKKVAPIGPQQSALSRMLNGGKSSNPFTEIYASVSGRSAPTSTIVSVYFPHAKQPSGKPMELTISRDATVEEVIGFALWTYWEEGWLPKLDDGLSGPFDPKWEDRISACGWILRLAEDDGEVDDDFPPPDRLGKITKFNADAYAILEASAAQIKQNREIETKIQRPIKTPAKKQPDKLAAPNTGPSAAGAPSLLTASWVGVSAPISTSLGPSSSHGPQIFLRIRVDTADAVHISTTIPVSAGMYMQEALEMVCRRRKLANPKDYALLLLADRSILIPLDRTVASLQGNRELLLVKRSALPMMGGNIVTGVGRTTDPNASIFKNPDTPEIQYTTPLDWTAAYKKYTIYRKMPMLVARQGRTLAVDGEWVHIMPSSNKAKNVFDSGRTSSYHIKTIADCQQSSKSSSTFKLVLTRSGGTAKRYDFEAENPKLASEIVQTIKNLKASLERSGTVNKSRRSRQVV